MLKQPVSQTVQVEKHRINIFALALCLISLYTKLFAMITNKWKKILKQLQQKKYRLQYGWFVVEGRKVIEECIEYAPEHIVQIFATDDLAYRWQIRGVPSMPVQEADIRALSALQNNYEAIAIMKMQQAEAKQASLSQNDKLLLYLDHIQDPGNLGSIVRLCDWYGVSHLIASPDTVDIWNTKSIQASKGSFLRVQVVYKEISTLLAGVNQITVWGADIQGKSVHHLTNDINNKSLPQKLMIVMGNEANGIRPSTKAYIQDFITIPKFGGAESLNVALAAAILLDNFKRVGY